jgi:hypothetical protein
MAANVLSTELQQEQPQFYTTLASHLSADEQSVIQNVYQTAEAAVVMAQQQQAAAAAGGVANGGTS